jgi:hypothetical protein
MFANGDQYEGEVIRGVMTGKGFLQCPGESKLCYRGDFKEGKLHGQGEFFVEDGTYKLAGNYTEGVPETEATAYSMAVSSPEAEEEDPKAKKDKKPATDEVEGQGHEIKIIIDNANPREEQRQLSFSLTVFFQGPDYEDPNPPEEDEKDKKKKKDAAAEPEIRMITPDPVTMEHEQGRQFEIELGRTEQVKIEKSQSMIKPSVEGEEEKESIKGEEEEEETQTEDKWIQYKFDQSKESNVLTVASVNGIVNVEKLVYELEPPSLMPGGWFEIIIRDVTKGIEGKRLADIRADIKIFDSEADAEKAA